MAELEHIRLEVADQIATITLDRPDNMNAYTGQMAYSLVEAFDRTDADDDVRVVIVTGAGKAFCAGADLSGGGFERGDFPEDYAPLDTGGMVGLRIFESKKPVIGAVNGAAAGIGATMLLSMDVRLASERAKFGYVFARRGIVPEAASTFFLPRIVGISTAMEWVATGRVFPAEEALEAGLVRSVHAPDDLLPAARALAREIADNTSPVSVALCRRMMWSGLGYDSPQQAVRAESRALHSRLRSDDVAEGVAAFFDKRAPNFPDTVTAGLPPILDDEDGALPLGPAWQPAIAD